MRHATLNLIGRTPASSHARGMCTSETADRLNVCNLDTLYVVQLSSLPSRILHMHLSSCSEFVICGRQNNEALHPRAARICELSLLRDSSTLEPVVARMRRHTDRLS